MLRWGSVNMHREVKWSLMEGYGGVMGLLIILACSCPQNIMRHAPIAIMSTLKSIGKVFLPNVAIAGVPTIVEHDFSLNRKDSSPHMTSVRAKTLECIAAVKGGQRKHVL